MIETQFRIGEELHDGLTWLVLAISVVAVVRLCFLLKRRSASKLYIVAGILGYFALSLAALRPVKLVRRGRAVGPKILVLADASRRLQLRADDTSRAKLAEVVVRALGEHFHTARLSVATFGEGAAQTLKSPERIREILNSANSSDLLAALDSVPAITDERPAAIVIVSDGRLTRPDSSDAIGKSLLPTALTGVPIHAVFVGGKAPPDASIRRVDSLGQAVAHQSFTLKIEVACSGGLNCSKIPVLVRALEKGKVPREIARLEADLQGVDSQFVNGEVLLERAGNHILEVSIDAPPGDEVPDNNTRLLPFNVTRDRIRLLHIAGSPSYDVRELRRWLKGNTAVDLVSFFILRTDEDNPNTDDNAGELSLIPFPVDELFSQHLTSFDAVVIQDIDAARYHLDVHLERLARYVEEGGGLILIGGPSAFSGGSYIHTALERVLPTSLVVSHSPYDTVDFVPRVTPAAAQSPILEPLRRLVGERLPSFPGANTLGPPKTGALVLWEHPQRTILPVKGATAGPMPVLAISDFGEGRVVELGLDASYRLAWGDVAAQTSGRAYGALWDALIGWVMHEQQYASLRGELAGSCISGLPVTVNWTLPTNAKGWLTANLERLGQSPGQLKTEQQRVEVNATAEIHLPALETGGYALTARLDGGAQARLNFVCERGGAALADSRPDADRLRKLSEALGGVFVGPQEIASLPVPPSYFVDETRTAVPIAPTWFWSTLAASFLGIEWLVARGRGFR